MAHTAFPDWPILVFPPGPEIIPPVVPAFVERPETLAVVLAAQEYRRADEHMTATRNALIEAWAEGTPADALMAEDDAAVEACRLAKRRLFEAVDRL